MRKKEIIKAATECFKSYGYDKATMSDIGKRVGLNKASLYHYYKNKETLFTDIINIERAEFLKNLDKETKNCDDPIEKLLRFGMLHFRHSEISEEIYSLSDESLIKNPGLSKILYHDAIKNGISFVKTTIDEGIKTGKIKKCDSLKIAETLAEALLAFTTNKSYHQRFAENYKDSGELKIMIENLLRLILDGLKV